MQHRNSLLHLLSQISLHSIGCSKAGTDREHDDTIPSMYARQSVLPGSDSPAQDSPAAAAAPAPPLSYANRGPNDAEIIAAPTPKDCRSCARREIFSCHCCGGMQAQRCRNVMFHSVPTRLPARAMCLQRFIAVGNQKNGRITPSSARTFRCDLKMSDLKLAAEHASLTQSCS